MSDNTENLQRSRPSNARLQRPDQAPASARGPALSLRDQAEAGPESDVGFDGEQRMVRRRRRTDDKFYVDPGKVKRGWSYEWKRFEVYGQPDSDHQVNLRENHWTPVPAARHPEMMPVGHAGVISKDGMVLMERPQYLTDEARQEDLDFARDQVRGATRDATSTPSGTLTRSHPSVERISRIKTSYGPISAEDF